MARVSYFFLLNEQIIGSISAVSSSLLVGKAGPMVHTGACIASLLGQGGSKKYRLTCKWLRFFKNDRDRRDLVTCGSAAGIAAAFRAPVGGVLFALEEMASWYVNLLDLVENLEIDTSTVAQNLITCYLFMYRKKHI
jgi:chloride channel 7